MLKTREDFEREDDLVLAPYATRDRDSGGRLKDSGEEDGTRSAYQQDSDRITWCHSYNRTMGKTQVLNDEGRNDHDKTRMPHETQVFKISRSIARRLGLNQWLCEAIAFGHDLGHTPFGHAGEKALNEVLIEKGHKEGFEHNRHSLYVVDELEDLDLTNATREGMMKHKSVHDQFGVNFEHSPHLEAQVVNKADEIAYVSHDLADGIRREFLNPEELKKLRLWKIAAEAVREHNPGLEENNPQYIKECVSQLIGFLIDDICITSNQKITEHNINSVEDVRKFNGDLIVFSDETADMMKEMSGYLMSNYYKSPEVEKSNEKGAQIIRDLFEIYYNDNDKLPVKYQERISNGENSLIVIRDYIAGMTDRFATNTCEELKKAA